MAASAEQSLLAREQAELLHEEIERLPRKFRLPVVLCYFEGLTVHEAARRLGWPHGTLRSRMARARERLRLSLTRRGIIMPSAAIAASLSARSASASISARLCETTSRAAIEFATGGSIAPLATALTRELLRRTLAQKVRVFAVSLWVLGAITTGAGYLTHALARNEEPAVPLVANRAVQPAQQQTGPPNPDAGRIVVTGRAITPDRKAVAGAHVAVVSSPQPRPEHRFLRESEHSEMLGSAAADSNGRFRVALPQNAGERVGLTLLAHAPGWALTGKILGDDIPGSDLTITMVPEQIVRGRILDVQGQPVSGVRVRVSRYHTLPFNSPVEALSWPVPATTDEQGRFTIRGVDPNTAVELETASDRHAPQAFTLDRRAAQTGGHVITLAPAQVIDVRTTRAEDGKPLPGVWVSILALQRRRSSQLVTYARTDDRGLARIIPATGESFMIAADPPGNEPYLDEQTRVDWPKGALRHTVEIKLSRGIRVRGTITEEGSGKPVASALVAYFQTTRNNPAFRRDQGQRRAAVTGPDGKFQIVVPAGPGHLLVRAAKSDYLHLVAKAVDLGLSASSHMYPDAMATIDLKAGAAPDELNMRLRRGVTIAGQVIGPDGAPVASAIAVGCSYRPYDAVSSALRSMSSVATAFPFSPFLVDAPKIKVRDGRFEIPGCDPEKRYTFYFLDREHQLGATVELSGKSNQNGPVTVQLEKCGSATVRFKDAQGNPVAGHQPGNDSLLIMTGVLDYPGADTHAGGSVLHTNLDTDRSRGLHSDADGRLTLMSLIPGAKYWLSGTSFTALAGTTIELPDLTLPRR